jgi:hypothetical protein
VTKLDRKREVPSHVQFQSHSALGVASHQPFFGLTILLPVPTNAPKPISVVFSEHIHYSVKFTLFQLRPVNNLEKLCQ